MSSATHQHSDFDNTALSAKIGDEATEHQLSETTQAAPSHEANGVTPPLSEKVFPISLDFTWEDCVFVAHITRDTNSKDALAVISANIGHLPYSAENAEMRAHALDVMKQHTNEITGIFKADIAGGVTFTQKTRLCDLDSAAAIVSALSLCLLQARPYLKIVQSILR